MASILISPSPEIETSLDCQISLCLCAWCPEGGLGSYQMGNGMFLRLIKVLPQSEVPNSLRLKAVLTLSPTTGPHLLIMPYSQAIVLLLGLHHSVTLLYPSPLVLSTFLMVTILLQVHSGGMEFGVAFGISLVNTVI